VADFFAGDEEVAPMHDHRRGAPDGIGGASSRLSAPARGLARSRAGAPRRFGRDERGNITLLAGLSIFLLIGVGALALDLAKLYLAKSTAQRVADQSAIAAAYAYTQNSNSSSTAQTAASSLAAANWASVTNVNTQIVAAPNGDGNQAAMVTVTAPVSMSPFGGTSTIATMSVNVSATAYAEMHVAQPCILALNGTGISAQGAGSVSATSCSVETGGSINAIVGTHLTAQAFSADGSIGVVGASVTTSPATGQIFPNVTSPPVDPYASAGQSLFSRLTTVASQPAPIYDTSISTPSGGTSATCTSSSSTLTLPSSVSYSTISTTYYPACTTLNFTGGAETDISGGLSLTGGSNVTLNFCPGTYKINNGISIFGSAQVTINVTTDSAICGSNANSPVVFDVWGGGNGAAISTSGGTSLTVNGPATYNLSGGIASNGTYPMIFTNNNGTGTSTFTVHGGLELANGGTVTFPDGTYVINSGVSGGTMAGIDLGGAMNVTFGNGSFNIACGINVAGGSKLTFGNALNSASLFRVNYKQYNGSSCFNYAISTGGGSTLTTGNFTNFDINGNVLLTGSVYFGSGLWTINGYLNAASAGGCCLVGTNVQLIASGAINLGQGYSGINLTAPSTITTATYGSAPSIVLASSSSAASAITDGATNAIINGAVYLPNSAMAFAGAGAITGNGSCMVVDVGSISFTGSGSISTNCTGVENTGANSVTLVQ
jgi:Flp pilus assembly protein TadG